MKEEKKYKMIQVSDETHKLLKEYCAYHGFKISGLIARLVREQIKKKV